jgi:hypothetical protein
VPWRGALEEVAIADHPRHSLIVWNWLAVSPAIQREPVHLGRDIVGVHRPVAAVSDYLCDSFME